jgi:hypothetical protein
MIEAASFMMSLVHLLFWALLHSVLVFFIQLFGHALDVVGLMRQLGDAISLQINANTVGYHLAQKIMKVNKKKMM